MGDWLAELLKPLAEWIFVLVMSVPLGVVRLIFLGILAALALWAISLPPQRPEPVEGRKPSLLSDLRLFAVGLLLLQSIFYLIF
jgi:hypothetical protein